MSDTNKLDKDLVTASRRSTRTNPVGDFYALDASKKSTLASAAAPASGLSQSARLKVPLTLLCQFKLLLVPKVRERSMFLKQFLHLQ